MVPLVNGHQFGKRWTIREAARWLTPSARRYQVRSLLVQIPLPATFLKYLLLFLSQPGEPHRSLVSNPIFRTFIRSEWRHRGRFPLLRAPAIPGWPQRPNQDRGHEGRQGHCHSLKGLRHRVGGHQHEGHPHSVHNTVLRRGSQRAFAGPSKWTGFLTYEISVNV